jgi:hypothetical protein
VYALVVDKKGPRLQSAKANLQCENADGCIEISNGFMTARSGTIILGNGLRCVSVDKLSGTRKDLR